VRRTLILLAGILVLAFAASAVASGNHKPTVKGRRTQIGKILVNGSGFTLYMFTKDRRNKDRCAKDCQMVWPPLTVKGRPTAGPGVRRSLLGTIRISGGRKQVTYDGHPLYTYSQASRPGDTSYVGANQFGGFWYALKANGKTVKSPNSGPGSPGGARSMTIDSAVETATGTPDYVTGTSDQVDVKMTVATSTPLTDAVLIYLTKGSCFQNLSDANQYTTNQFIANDPASVGDRSVVNWLNQGVPAGSASGTFDAVSAVGSGYSTVCATIYNQHVDPITNIVTNTPYFTISAPLRSG
jgi:predicted lipoprotein with Yx(FWY)xxD motif